jgi:hypothetical protein
MPTAFPDEVQQVFERFITTEYTTIDGRGQPIVWPVTPYPEPDRGCVDVTTGLGYPKKANDARANPHVALLFSEPVGSGLEAPPTVLIQGTAHIDDTDLDANRARYERESIAKLPATESMQAPAFLRGSSMFLWYYARLYVHVRPERIYVWPAGEGDAEPQLLDARMEEVRSGHSEEPPAAPPDPEGGGAVWDARIDELGSRYDTAVLSFVGPDGFPFSVRVPVRTDKAAGRIRIASVPPGTPIRAGLACLVAHDHAPDFAWQRNFQVRGDLLPDDSGWSLLPHRMIGGFEIPPTSALNRLRANFAKVRRFRKIAKRELAAREARAS